MPQLASATIRDGPSSRIVSSLARHDFAVLDRLHVIRHAHHAVRVVALQVRIDEAGRDEPGLCGRHAAGLQEAWRRRIEGRAGRAWAWGLESGDRRQVSGGRSNVRSGGTRRQ